MNMIAQQMLIHYTDIIANYVFQAIITYKYTKINIQITNPYYSGITLFKKKAPGYSCM